MANNNPDTAINNADSHEYFAENTPQLTMGDGSGTDTTTSLILNQPVSGSVTTGNWVYYQVSGATAMNLYNLTTDSDLYVRVGEQPTLADYDCASLAGGTSSETCEVNASDIVYIGVYGFRGNGNYTLDAITAQEAIPQLSINQPVLGSVLENGWVFYQVTGVTDINLYNLATDLDLFVRVGALPSLNDFDCASIFVSNASETCKVNASDTV